MHQVLIQGIDNPDVISLSGSRVLVADRKLFPIQSKEDTNTTILVPDSARPSIGPERAVPKPYKVLFMFI